MISPQFYTAFKAHPISIDKGHPPWGDDLGIANLHMIYSEFYTTFKAHLISVDKKSSAFA
jgi:hypothetical protein